MQFWSSSLPCGAILLWVLSTSAAGSQSVPALQQGQSEHCTDASAVAKGPNNESDCAVLTATFTKGLNSTYLNQYAVQELVSTWGPAWNFGGDDAHHYGWRNQHVLDLSATFAARGLHTGFAASVNTHATGDSEAQYWYGFCDGGVYAISDEGCSIMSLQGGENPGYFHGRVTAGGPGATTPTLTFNSGNNWTTDGTFLLDITGGTISGHLAGDSRPLSGPFRTFLAFLTVDSLAPDNRLPLTRALGAVLRQTSQTDAIPDPHIAGSASAPVTLTVELQPIGGSIRAFTPGGLVCVAGSRFPEVAPINAVGPVTGTLQKLTLSVRNPNTEAAIFQGGVCGQYISFDANLKLSGYRTSYYAFGSLNGTDLIYGNKIAGGLGRRPIPDLTGSSEVESVHGPNSGFHLYPGAEIVMNSSTGATPVLEPNAVNWAAGDLVENPHAQTVGGSGLFLYHHQHSPTSSYFGSNAISISSGGFGISGYYHFFNVFNDNPATAYLARGGQLSAPILLNASGSYGEFFSFAEGPQPGRRASGAMFTVLTTASGKPLPFSLFDLPMNVKHDGEESLEPHAGEITYDPASGAVAIPTSLVMPALAAKTGTRFLCIDTAGRVVSQTAPCSGT